MLVVKLGGSLDERDLAGALSDLAGLWSSGQGVILLHGCGAEADELTRRLGEEPRHVTSASGLPSRYTPPRHLEIFLMAAAVVNARLTAALQRRGVRALGLLPSSGRILEARRQETLIVRQPDGRKQVLRDDQTGRVERVEADLLRRLVEAGYLPVLAPLAAGADGSPLNVDGDRASAVVAGALGAETLLLLTDVPGLLARFPDPASLVREASRGEVDRLMAMAQGRMKKKVHSAGLALEAGVGRVILASGRGQRPIARALEGEGTVIR